MSRPSPKPPAGNKKKLGPRITVKFSDQGGGKDKKNPRFIFMLKKTAEALKLPLQVDFKVKKQVKGKDRTVLLRGSKGAKSIRVRLTSSSEGKPKYLSVPVPSNATLEEVLTFLEKVKGIDSFVSPNGRSYPINASRRNAK